MAQLSTTACCGQLLCVACNLRSNGCPYCRLGFEPVPFSPDSEEDAAAAAAAAFDSDDDSQATTLSAGDDSDEEAPTVEYVALDTPTEGYEVLSARLYNEFFSPDLPYHNPPSDNPPSDNHNDAGNSDEDDHDETDVDEVLEAQDIEELHRLWETATGVALFDETDHDDEPDHDDGPDFFPAVGCGPDEDDEPDRDCKRQRLNSSDGATWFQVFVRTVSGRTVVILVHSQFTVLQLKEALLSQLGWFFSQPRDLVLLWGGRQLADLASMADHNITSGATIHMVMRLRGGASQEEVPMSLDGTQH
jgi:hypothetical protein